MHRQEGNLAGGVSVVLPAFPRNLTELEQSPGTIQTSVPKPAESFLW